MCTCTLVDAFVYTCKKNDVAYELVTRRLNGFLFMNERLLALVGLPA